MTLTIDPQQPFFRAAKFAVYNVLPSFRAVCSTSLIATTVFLCLCYLFGQKESDEELLDPDDEEHTYHQIPDNFDRTALRLQPANIRKQNNEAYINGVRYDQQSLGNSYVSDGDKSALSYESPQSSLSSSSSSEESDEDDDDEEEEEAITGLSGTHNHFPLSTLKDKERRERYSPVAIAASSFFTPDRSSQSSPIKHRLEPSTPKILTQLRTPTATERFKRYRSPNETPKAPDFHCGMLVLRRRPKQTFVYGVDETDLWDGPFPIKSLSNDKVELEFPQGSKASPIVTKESIKPYIGETPEKVELEEGWFVVSKIRGRRVCRVGNSLREEVRVAWDGSPSEDDTWQLASSVGEDVLEDFDERQAAWKAMGRAR
ncbi:hypothetical protein EDC01DRAFT_659592 [Geopyxis carbonaria]|nr:hypothetical protein EDC01DRAFT_659592 [Geopyxis carbonaria]